MTLAVGQAIETVYLDSPFGLQATFSWHPQINEAWTYTDGNRVRFRYEYTDPRPRDAVILMIDAGPYGQRTGGYYNSHYLSISGYSASFEKDWDTLRAFFLETGITPPDTEQLVKVKLRLPVAYKLWFHRQSWTGFWWQTSDRYVIADPAYLNVDSEFSFLSVPQLPPELLPAPTFLTDLCQPKEATVGPTDSVDFHLTIENNENAGDIYLGVLCDGWRVLHTAYLRALKRLSHAFSQSPKEIAGRDFSESEILYVDFVVGHVAEGYEDYRPDTVTGRWRMTIYVIVGQPEVYTCPYCGQTFPTQYQLEQHIKTAHPEEGKLPSWLLPVGIVAVGGTIIYAATRSKER